MGPIKQKERRFYGPHLILPDTCEFEVQYALFIIDTTRASAHCTTTACRYRGLSHTARDFNGLPVPHSMSSDHSNVARSS